MNAAPRRCFAVCAWQWRRPASEQLLIKVVLYVCHKAPIIVQIFLMWVSVQVNSAFGFQHLDDSCHVVLARRCFCTVGMFDGAEGGVSATRVEKPVLHMLRC